MTNGVAIPSLRPLSTFSARRILAGTAGFVTTASPRAASVGARIDAMSAAAAHPASGKSNLAATVPRTIVSGRPTRSSRTGRRASPSTSRSRTVAASAKSRTPSVSSVMTSVVSLSRPDGKMPTPLGPRTRPATTKKIGAVMSDRSRREARSPYATNTATRAAAPLTFVFPLLGPVLGRLFGTWVGAWPEEGRPPVGADRRHDEQRAARQRPHADGDHHSARHRVGRDQDQASAQLHDTQDQPADRPSMARMSFDLEGSHKSKCAHRRCGEPEDVDRSHRRDDPGDELAQHDQEGRDDCHHTCDGGQSEPR